MTVYFKDGTSVASSLWSGAQGIDANYMVMLNQAAAPSAFFPTTNVKWVDYTV